MKLKLLLGVKATEPKHLRQKGLAAGLFPKASLA